MAKIGDKPGDLPRTSYVSLAEFFTWVIDGVARDDAAVKQLAVEQSERDSEVWGDAFGPGWLKHLLKLIGDGHDVYPKRDCADAETYEINQRHFLRAQRWLKRHGGSAAWALAEVEQELARRQDRDPRHIALERLLYDRASAGKLTVKARKWDDARNCAASEYQSIPADFFLRPCRFFYAIFHGDSELVRWPDDGSPNGLLDSVFNKSDPPVSYIEAKIARGDALALRDLFISDGSPQPVPLQAKLDASSPGRHNAEALPLDHRARIAWKPNWLSLASAIMWVVTRDKTLTRIADEQADNDRDIVLSISPRLAYEEAQNGAGHREHIEIEDAWPALRRLIADEKIVAEGRSLERRGVDGAIETSYPNERIPSGDAAKLVIRGGVPGIEPKDALAPDEVYQLTNWQGRYWYDVRLRAADVFRELPDSLPLKHRTAGSRQNKTSKLALEPAGRGDAELLMVAFKACYPGGVPQGTKKQEVYNKMAAWIKQDRGRAPPVRKTFDRHRKKFWPDS